MKKISAILPIGFTLMVFTSCQLKTTDTFKSYEYDEPKTELTIVHSKDKIVSATVKSTYRYVHLNVKDKQEAKDNMDTLFPDIDLDDPQTKINYNDDNLEITTSDDSVLEAPSLTTMYPDLFSEDGTISYQRLESFLLIDGYKKSK